MMVRSSCSVEAFNLMDTSVSSVEIFKCDGHEQLQRESFQHNDERARLCTVYKLSNVTRSICSVEASTNHGQESFQCVGLQQVKQLSNCGLDASKTIM